MSLETVFIKLAHLLFLWLIQARHVRSDPSPEIQDFKDDPILRFRPDFVQSLPVQILLTGIVLTLVVVLFIHLTFSAQYHWPLAPVNYVLQLSGVLTLLISLIATLYVVLNAALDESMEWPYMLSYIAVNVPPSEDRGGWSLAELVTWMVMNASTSGLVQITHIQFLTLLFPSRLEGILIFVVLGPLAILAAIMQLMPIHHDPGVVQVASAARNVCNATLSLIFTIFLFIWGLFVNRRQAWRVDGGTAAFGVSALTLTVVGTALNFLYIPREEQFVWLPGLMQAIVLWQSFLGFWWWVGAGSGGGLEKLGQGKNRLSKQEREDRKRLKREKKQEARRLTKKTTWNDVARVFAFPQQRDARTRVESSPSVEQENTDPPREDENNDRVETDTASTCSSLTSTRPAVMRFLPAFSHRWYNHIRQAHVIAARAQAVERVERMRERERDGDTRVDGWGLGNFRLRSVSKERAINAVRDGDAQNHEREAVEAKEGQTGTSMWYWGLLRKWRLQDSTVYSK